MRRSGTPVRVFLVLAAALAMSSVWAQLPGTAGAVGGQEQQLVGVWQTTVHLDPNIPPAIGVLQVLSDGSYREELYLYDQLAAYWSGHLRLAQDGTLTQTETDVSPQICVPQGCMPNDPPVTFSTFVQFHNADVFSMSDMNVTVTYSRFYLPTGSTGRTTPSAQTPGSQAGSIVGSWQNAYYHETGAIINVRTFQPDGTFVSTGYTQGGITNSEAGVYTMGMDGVLTLEVRQATPQFCFHYCEPNPTKPGSVFRERVTFQGTDLLLVDDVRAPGGKFYWERGDGTRGPVIAAVPPSASGGPASTPGGLASTPPVTAMPGMGGYVPAGGGSGSNAEFINGVIHGQSAYTNQNDGSSYYLPDVADPDTNYYSPSGNEVVYNDITGGWTEIDSYGFETELEGAW